MIEYLIKLPVLKRLIPSIFRRYYKIMGTSRKYYKIGNINYYLDFLDPMDRLLILNKNYEYDQVIYFEQTLRKFPFSYFIDIGANSGYYSFHLADKFKNLKIKSFEINNDAYSKFTKTLEKNSFKNIELFRFGLSNINKQSKIKSMVKDGFTHSNATVIDSQDTIDPKKFKIREAQLKVGDGILNFENEYLSIKIDVEGHEIFTLKGLIKNLSNNYCLLLIEIFDDNFNEVNNFLKKINYNLIFKSVNRPDYIFSNINFTKN